MRESSSCQVTIVVTVPSEEESRNDPAYAAKPHPGGPRARPFPVLTR